MQPADCLLALRATLPHLAAQSATRLGQGWANWTFLTDTGFAVRFPKTPQAAIDLERSVALLGQLGDELPVAIPTVVERGVWAELPFMLYRALPGRPASEWLHAGGDAMRLTGPLAELVAALHAVPTPSLTGLDAESSRPWRERCATTTDAATELAVPLLAEAAVNRLRHVTAELAELSAPRQETLLHGDLTLLNLLVDEQGGLTGLLDFDDATIGDPAFDLRFVATELPHAALFALLTAYGDAADAAFRTRLRLYAELAPVIDAVERFEAGDETTGRQLLTDWAEAVS